MLHAPSRLPHSPPARHAHPLVERLPAHRTRARIAELRRRGFVELSRLLAPWHLAELVRPADGAEVSVCRGAGGEVIIISDRPLWAARQLELWEVHP